MANCCNEYFCKPKDKADANIYKLCKNRLMEVYGPKPEEDYKRATSIVLTGLPSEAAKEIRAAMCDKNPPLTDCCCAKAVGAMWRDLLPPTVKAAVASMNLQTDFDTTIKHADQVFNSLKPTVAQPVALVAPSKPPKAKATAAAADLDTSADAPALDQMAHLTQEIAAFNKNFKAAKKQQQQRGGGASGGQGKRKGGAGRPQRARSETPHPDGPPENACDIHWRFGRSAYYCLTPSTCPWAMYKSAPK